MGKISQWLSQNAIPFNKKEGENQTVWTLESIGVLEVKALQKAIHEASEYQFTFSEDQYHNRPEIVHSKLNSLLGKSTRIHGRKTKIVSLNQPDMDSFLEANHILGKAKSKHKYGLELNGTLVAALALGKKCPIDRIDGQWQSMEIVRFCNVLNHTVVGGLDKLVKHIIKTHKPDDLMTAIDLHWGSGAAFEKLGFVEERFLEPICYYLDSTTDQRRRSPKGAFQIWNGGSRIMLLKLKQA